MLGKVIRYEFKSTARLFLLMYAALIVVAAINMIIIPWDGDAASGNAGLDIARNMVSGIMVALYVVLAIATAVITMVIIVMRFYKMLGDEGYLWFTLPVTVNQHILAKLITAVVWCITSTVAIILSLLVLFARLYYLDEIAEVWHQITSTEINVAVWIVLFIVLLLASALSGILMFYAAISVGPHITRSRLGGSVIAYVIAYIATQIIATVATLIGFSAIGNMSFDELAALDGTTPDAASAAYSAMFSTIDQIGLLTFWMSVIIAVILGAAGYIVTNRMLTKKLNLA
jgi:hypothetical protein